MYVCKYIEFILQVRPRTNDYYQRVTVLGSIRGVDMPIALKCLSLSLWQFDCFSAIHDSLMTLLFVCLHLLKKATAMLKMVLQLFK